MINVEDRACTLSDDKGNNNSKEKKNSHLTAAVFVHLVHGRLNPFLQPTEAAAEPS